MNIANICIIGGHSLRILANVSLKKEIREIAKVLLLQWTKLLSQQLITFKNKEQLTLFVKLFPSFSGAPNSISQHVTPMSMILLKTNQYWNPNSF